MCSECIDDPNVQRNMKWKTELKFQIGRGCDESDISRNMYVKVSDLMRKMAENLNSRKLSLKVEADLLFSAFKDARRALEDSQVAALASLYQRHIETQLVAHLATLPTSSDQLNYLDGVLRAIVPERPASTPDAVAACESVSPPTNNDHQSAAHPAPVEPPTPSHTTATQDNEADSASWINGLENIVKCLATHLLASSRVSTFHFVYYL